MTAPTERIVVVDQSDPNRGRIDRSRFGKPNPNDTEPRPVITPEDFEATRAELSELWRRMKLPARAEGADIRVRDVAVSEDELTVALMDGRTISVPLAWYPRLAAGTPEQRAHWELAGAGYGIHWPELDEDLSTEGLLAGARAPRGSETWRSRLLGDV